MAYDKVKSEAGHKAGRTGRKSIPRADRKVAANKRRRAEDWREEYGRQVQAAHAFGRGWGYRLS